MQQHCSQIFLELAVSREGRVTAVTPLRTTSPFTNLVVVALRDAPPFDDAAVAAARQWIFCPARLRGTPVSTLVYIVFGFPIPVGTGPVRE